MSNGGPTMKSYTVYWDGDVWGPSKVFPGKDLEFYWDIGMCYEMVEWEDDAGAQP